MEENVEPAASEQPTPLPPSEWFGIWIRAVTKPSEDTYVEIARHADVKTAYIWVLLAFLALSAINVALLGALTIIFGVVGIFGNAGQDALTLALLMGIFLCVVLVYIIFEMAVFSGMTALSNAIAKAFGGVGDFRRLVYCFAAYAFPISIALLVVSIFLYIPIVGQLFIIVDFALVLYALVLNVIAIKAVHQIETWQAIVPSVVNVALILVIACCVVIGLVALSFLEADPTMFENLGALPLPGF